MIGIKKFHNIHKGKTCYIFGDGPSIKWFDLSQFNNHVGISCGLQMIHKDFNKINVKYYAIPEPWLFHRYWHWRTKFKDKAKVLAMKKFMMNFINRHKYINFFFNFSNIGAISGSNIYLIHRYLIKHYSELSFLNGMDPFGGTFNTVLFLAYYMGFSKVYLVGFDAFTDDWLSPFRWYEMGDGKTGRRNETTLDPFLKILKKKLDIYSISLHNSTKSEFNFKNISYSKLTKKNPIYKENYELIELKTFKIMEKLLVNRKLS